MGKSGTEEITRGALEWRHCDVVMKFLTDKLKQPEEKLGLGGRKATARPVMTIVACAIHPDLSSDIALGKLREYIKTNNPELYDEDFGLRIGWNDHSMTRFPGEDEILRITAAGCFYEEKKGTGHEHSLRPVLVRNPDEYYLACREDVVASWRCVTCPHVEPSPGWDGQKRIRRDELCECCDGPVKKTDGISSQDMGRHLPMRIIHFYECTKCGHTQYYYKDD